MRTTVSAKSSEVERKWYVVDASGQTLGRLSSEIAKILRGKHKPIYTPHVDTGDFVIVVNAEKIQVTGKKMDQKLYTKHSGYVGGLSQITMREMKAKKPEFIIKHAVKGMLPKNSLGRQMLKKLNVYLGPEHLHQSQQPEVLAFNS